MLWTWICGIIFALCIVGLIFGIKDDLDGLLAVSIMFSIISFAGLLGTIADISEVNKYVTNTKDAYYLNVAKIEEYTVNTDFRMLKELSDDCSKMDERINKNRKLYNTCRGKHFSKEIADLELLTPKFLEKFNNKEN